MKKILVHNLIILDESGSMGSVYHSTIDGFNSFMKNIKSSAEEFPEQDHKISFVSFNDKGMRYVAENVPADSVPSLSTGNYRPAGGTPLFDALGAAVNRLREKTEYFPETTVLVSIFTDGYENASVEFNAKSIRDLVNSLEQKGWTFTYIGTDHDVTEVSRHLNIKNTMSFEKSKEGMNTMFNMELKHRRDFYSSLNDEKRNRKNNYFDEGEEGSPGSF